MKDIYLVNYSVKGIKTIDQLVSLSFYKKIIPRNPDTQDYNVKGIYGMNGSGKSGIVTAVEILKNLLTNPEYLMNPIAQKNLDAMINKKLNELYIEIDYMAKTVQELMLFRYNIRLAKDVTGKYVIVYESLAKKKATAKNEIMEKIFEVSDGEFLSLYGLENQNAFSTLIWNKTMNLLQTSSVSAVFYEKILPRMQVKMRKKDILLEALCKLYRVGMKLHVYMDASDDHREYVARNSIGYFDDAEKRQAETRAWIRRFYELDSDFLGVVAIARNLVEKQDYEEFEKSVNKLYEFLHIFKADLQGIEIDKKEDRDFWICDLIMVYEDYKIQAEFESTGIKKLIRLFAYLRGMVQGEIVFIDEFDSNLHDVYLCALLEYLMEYGEGQLCFTTHNVGPMDILRKRKKSIDFLSEDHKIYSWTTNGNYSPSKLYRNGMIEGSPFNVDSIDFIGAFGSGKGDE